MLCSLSCNLYSLRNKYSIEQAMSSELVMALLEEVSFRHCPRVTSCFFGQTKIL